MFKYIDSGIKLDNSKYNQKLPHIYVMTKWMANNYFFVIKSIFGFHLLEAILMSLRMWKLINMWKLLVILIVIFSFAFLSSFKPITHS